MRLQHILFLFLFVTQSVFAYTVVTNSGKRVAGEYVSEDQTTLQLRDRTGIMLSFKKAHIDIAATAQANELPIPKEIENSPSIAKLPKKSDPDLVQFARKIQEGRTGKARVYTSDHLKNAPEISYSESEDAVRSSAGQSKSNADEKYWRQQAAKLKDQLREIQTRKQKMEESCARAMLKQDQQSLRPLKPSELTPLPEPKECMEIPKVAERLQDAQWELDDFQEEARKLEIPWSWID